MISRIWPALCAWGAGLLHLASGAGSAPHPLGILLIVVGVAEFVWGLAALRTPKVAVAGVVLPAALVSIALSAAAALTGAMAWLPLAAATVQLLIISVIAAYSLRARQPSSPHVGSAARPLSSPEPFRPGHTGRTIASVALCAALVSGLTTPALAATDAGDFAVPHGSHSHHG